MQRRFFWRRFLGGIVLLGIALVFLQIPWGRSHRTAHGMPRSYAPHGDERRLDSGAVDYCSTMNHLLAEGIPAHSNAVLDYYQLLGDRIFGSQLAFRSAFLRRIGADSETAPTAPLAEAFGKLLTQPTFLSIYEQPWSDSQFPAIADWIDSNSDFLAELRESTRKEFFHPYLSSADAQQGPSTALALLPLIQGTRDLARILTADAMRELHRGNLASAMADAQALQRMARQLDHSHTLIEHLVAMALSRMGQDILKRILLHGSIDDSVLNSLAETLNADNGLISIAEPLSRGERYLVLETLQMADRQGIDYHRFGDVLSGQSQSIRADLGIPGWLGWSRFVDWGTAAEFANRWFDQRIQLIDNLDSGVQIDLSLARLAKNDVSEIAPETPALMQCFSPHSRGLAQGKFLIGLLGSSMSHSIGASMQTRQHWELLQTAVAVERFRFKQGAYPTRLEELVPEFLPAVPPDRFRDSGKVDYRLDSSRFIVSVSGRPPNDNRPASDYQIEVPRRRP